MSIYKIVFVEKLKHIGDNVDEYNNFAIMGYTWFFTTQRRAKRTIYGNVVIFHTPAIFNMWCREINLDNGVILPLVGNVSS